MRTHDADREFWNGMAPRYVRGGGRRTPVLMDELLADLPSLSDEPTCVDLACGPGRTTARVLQAIPGARVVGVDLSPAMLEYARAEHDGIDFRRGRDTSIPVEDASQDLVLCSLGLMLFPDPADCFREVARVLRPGARFRVGVWGRATHTNFPTFGVAVARRLGHELPAPPRSNFHLGEPDALEAAAEGTPMRLVGTRRFALTFPYDDPTAACRDLGCTDEDPGLLKDAIGTGWAAFVEAARLEAERLLAADGHLVMDTLIGEFERA